ncbi:MAG: CT583 family protein [Parachlamydiaceae bacterium]
MAKVNSILDQRMNKPGKTSKMAEMAKQSATGHLTTFSGMFSVTDLSEKEKEQLTNLLKHYSHDQQEIGSDLNFLISLTCEVKAINNQAALLHGERIKKAHEVLTRYREGAFTAWLMAAYGNRQTPYNLMQYYNFCEEMPKQLRSKIELIPRQAIYVLASREGDLKEKQVIVENYQGETKAQMLTMIRRQFPLGQTDHRQKKGGKAVIQELQRLHQRMEDLAGDFTLMEKKQAFALLEQIKKLIGPL